MTVRSWQPLCYVLLLALSSCQRASCSIESNLVDSTAATLVSNSAPEEVDHRQQVPETDDIGGGDPDSCLDSQHQHQHQRNRGQNVMVEGKDGTSKKPPSLLDGDEAVEVRKGEEAAAALASTTTAPGSTTDDLEDEGDGEGEGEDSSSIPERYIVGCGGDVVEAGRR